MSMHYDVEVCMHIDGSHDVHVDGKGHSGMCLIMGRGLMMNASKKLGLVTTISTETDIVADGERFSKCSWFMHFRLLQGDEAKEEGMEAP